MGLPTGGAIVHAKSNHEAVSADVGGSGDLVHEGSCSGGAVGSVGAVEAVAAHQAVAQDRLIDHFFSFKLLVEVQVQAAVHHDAALRAGGVAHREC